MSTRDNTTANNTDEDTKMSAGENTANGKVEQQVREFTYAEIKEMTKDFAKRIGKGSYGEVFLGSMSNGTPVAVKRFLRQSADAEKDLMAEVKLKIASHPNLTPFFGYCKGKMSLVFKYMPNGSLKRFLSAGSPIILTWQLRLKIGSDAAKGLLYLHEERNHIHRDIKPENILLDEKFEAKLADFGLVKEISADATHVSTMSKGTLGYLDPEYWNNRKLRRESDVYSLGVVLLQLITGKPVAVKLSESEGFINISEWVNKTQENGSLRETVVDAKLSGNFDRRSAEKALNLGIACTSEKAVDRPNMREVVKTLDKCLKLIDALKENQVSQQNNSTSLLDNNTHINDNTKEIANGLTAFVGHDSRTSRLNFNTW